MKKDLSGKRRELDKERKHFIDDLDKQRTQIQQEIAQEMKAMA